MQFDHLRLNLDDFNERLDRLVGLLVQQEIKSLEVRLRQSAGLGYQMLDIDARGQPAERKKKRQCDQPPVFDFHCGRRGSGWRIKSVRPCPADRWRASTRGFRVSG